MEITLNKINSDAPTTPPVTCSIKVLNCSYLQTYHTNTIMVGLHLAESETRHLTSACRLVRPQADQDLTLIDWDRGKLHMFCRSQDRQR